MPEGATPVFEPTKKETMGLGPPDSVKLEQSPAPFSGPRLSTRAASPAPLFSPHRYASSVAENIKEEATDCKDGQQATVSLYK
jgi:hypothetical protein